MRQHFKFEGTKMVSHTIDTSGLIPVEYKVLVKPEEVEEKTEPVQQR